MNRRIATMLVLLALVVFLGWRLLRPMNIFVVDDRFAWPVDTAQMPPVPGEPGAGHCATCHQSFYDEWRTTIHSQAWTDPYFQADWQFDDAQYTCRLCHTPLDRQQPRMVLNYRDRDRWDPVLTENPDFDAELQHEGVTCAACHYREGKIVGVFGDTGAPHPVKKLADPNQVCVRCHVVEGDRWDTFFRLPPCGTVAEIGSTLAAVADHRDPEIAAIPTESRETGSDGEPAVSSGAPDAPVVPAGKSGEMTAGDTGALACVNCHMPLIRRPLVEGGVLRDTRQHLWRGGHDPQMVKDALSVDFVEQERPGSAPRVFRLTLTNTGAAHYVPTGTPDRHLTVQLRALDEQGDAVNEKIRTIERTVLWRPFIVDLWDNRLVRGQPRQYELEVPADSRAVKVEAEVRYHLLHESRRRRIGYENTSPVSYTVFLSRIALQDNDEEGGGG